jgi:Phage integrase family
MRPPKPEKPAHLETRGLVWRPRKRNWIGLWIPRQDIAAKGYPIKSRRLWPPSSEPAAIATEDDWEDISAACEVLQNEMLTWGSGVLVHDQLAGFDDTIASLIRIYLTHRDRPYHDLRHNVQTTYSRRMSYISRDFGDRHISALTLSDFKEMYKFWLAPKEPNGKRRISHAHEQMVYVRQIFRFGKALKLPGCRDAKDILDEMEFPNVKRRKTIVSNEQAILIRAEAHRRELPSIALAQAFQTSLGVRQKDAVGEWIPVSDPGLSDVHDGNWKWVVGFRWEEIGEDFRIEHRLSKSLRGRDAIADQDEGKVKDWRLTLYPMVVEELAMMAGVSPAELRRDMLPASGPIVIAEHNGLPWIDKVFQTNWRKIARAVGIPDEVQNRDSRAGAATDAELKGADIEKVRQQMGHSKPDTTRIYLRDESAATAEIAKLRFGKKE